jgi:hypothetical protein
MSMTSTSSPSSAIAQADTNLFTIVDVTGNYSLSLSSTGSFTVALKTNTTNFTTIEFDSGAIADNSQTPSFYYSNAISTYGVSRFWSVDTKQFPLSSKLITLTILNIVTTPQSPEDVVREY